MGTHWALATRCVLLLGALAAANKTALRFSYYPLPPYLEQYDADFESEGDDALDLAAPNATAVRGVVTVYVLDSADPSGLVLANTYQAPAGPQVFRNRLRYSASDTARHGYALRRLSVLASDSVDPEQLYPLLGAATALRDGVVDVLGRVLFTDGLRLPGALSPPLRVLYDAFRLKLIPSVDLVFVLRETRGMSAREKFSAVLSAVEGLDSAPEAARAAARRLSAAARTGEMDVMELTEGGTNPPRMLGPDEMDLPNAPKFPSRSLAAAPRHVRTIFGALWAAAVGAVLTGALQLTQPLVAHMLRHLPLGRAPDPELLPAVTLAADALARDAPSMELMLANISRHDQECPYHVVRAVMANIVTRCKWDRPLSYAAQVLFHHVTHDRGAPPRAMAELLRAEPLDLRAIFAHVYRGEYPDDVVQAKESLMSHVDARLLDVAPALKGFLRYDYTDSPLQMVIALLDRIRRRASVPAPLNDALASIDVHVKCKYATVYQESRRHMDVADLSFLFNAFRTLKTDLKDLAKRVKNILLSSAVLWGDVINKFPLQRNSRPRQTVMDIVKYVYAKKLVRGMEIERFLSYFSSQGEPVLCSDVCPKLQKVRWIVHKFESPPKKGTIQDVNLEDLFRSIPSTRRSADGEDRRAVRFLSGPELPRLLGERFNVHNYPTRGELLQAILDRARQDKAAAANARLMQSFRHLEGMLPLAGDLAEPWLPQRRDVDVGAALDALDRAALDADADKRLAMNVLLGHLASHPLNLSLAAAARTKADYLHAMFRQLEADPAVPSPVKGEAGVVGRHVEAGGRGAEPLEYVVVREKSRDAGSDETPLRNRQKLRAMKALAASTERYKGHKHAAGKSKAVNHV